MQAPRPASPTAKTASASLYRRGAAPSPEAPCFVGDDIVWLTVICRLNRVLFIPTAEVRTLCVFKACLTHVGGLLIHSGPPNGSRLKVPNLCRVVLSLAQDFSSLTKGISPQR